MAGYALVIDTIEGPQKKRVGAADVNGDNKTRIQFITLLVKERKKEVTRQRVSLASLPALP
jgi:hypothetical protein